MEENTMEWISVKDRLPENYERVFVAISYTATDGSKKFSLDVSEIVPLGGKKYWNHNAHQFIEFWMLPEYPKP